MHTVGRSFSDHDQPATDYRARILISPEDRSPAKVKRCLTRQRWLLFVFYFPPDQAPRRAALRTETDHCASLSLQPAKVCIFVGVNACGQILRAKPFGVSWVALLSRISLLRAALCRRCPLLRRENRGSGETIAAKTDWQQLDRAPPHRHFDERTEFRCPGG